MMHIVIDGIDGSGKDSQAGRLMSAWREQALDPVLVLEPDVEMPGGPEIRRLLKSGEHPSAQLGLFLANRMALQEAKVAPALAAGRPVVNVRSFISTLVYQQEQGWPLDWLFDIHRQLLCKPTHIIILDIAPEVALARTRKRPGPNEVYERLSTLTILRQRYLDLAKDPRLPPFLAESDGAYVIDALGTPEEVHARIIELLG